MAFENTYREKSTLGSKEADMAAMRELVASIIENQINDALNQTWHENININLWAQRAAFLTLNPAK